VKPLAITAFTTTGPLGRGSDATLAALRSRRSGLRPYDLDSTPL